MERNGWIPRVFRLKGQEPVMEIVGLVHWTDGCVVPAEEMLLLEVVLGKRKICVGLSLSTCFFLLALSKTERDGGVLQLHFYFYQFLS